MTLCLYHAPLACSIAARFALVEAGVPHEVKFIRTWKGENKTEAFLAINARGKVPVLVTDEGTLTESTAILPFIADLAPEKGLFPEPGGFARAQAQSHLSFLSSTVHAAYAAALMPSPGCDGDAAVDRLGAVMQEVDAQIAGRDHVLDVFGVCDLYLTVFLLWRNAPAVAGRLPPLPNLDRVQQAVLSRPGLMAIVAEEMAIRAEP